MMAPLLSRLATVGGLRGSARFGRHADVPQAATPASRTSGAIVARRPGPAVRLAAMSAVVLLVCFAFSGTVVGADTASAQAVIGQPFGVGQVTLRLSTEQYPQPLGAEGLRISERNGRVFYPAVVVPQWNELVKQIWQSSGLLEETPAQRQVKGLINALVDRPPPITLYFLFQGEQPLELTIHAQRPLQLTLPVGRSLALWKAQRDQWWKAYTAQAGLLTDRIDAPPVVAQVLRPTLARRLNLALPRHEQTPSPSEVLQQELALWAGSESMFAAMLQDRLLGLLPLDQRADQPLPENEQSPPPQFEAPADVAVEPMAMHVPAECFYVRFGDFRNFLWVQDTLAAWGGDAANLVAARGIDYQMRSRMEEQLVVQQTALSRLMGDKIIADVALIGTDLFFREGAAYGLLFQAKVNMALAADFTRRRSEWVAREQGKDVAVELAGTKVSCLVDRHGLPHCYYAVSGDFHFVTTSRRLAERFLEASSGKDSLGATAEFRAVRARAPADAGDAAFVYFSDAFFNNITGPAYRIEMIRRVHAQCDLLALQMAGLIARAEGRPHETAAQLIAGGYLPECFGPRPDGSEATRRGDQFVDSLRGPRGRFTPIPDIPPTTVTRAEAADYRRFAEFLRSHWGRPAPLLARVLRESADAGRERITIIAEMNPLQKLHFDVLGMLLGDAQSRRIAPAPGDLIRAEVALPRQYFFFGLRDAAAVPPETANMLGWLPLVLRSAYLGTDADSPILNPSAFNLLPNLPLPGGERALPRVLNRRIGEFHVFALSSQVLDEVAPHLARQPAEPAQLRLDVADPSQARFASWINSLGFARTRNTSLGNLLLLQQMEQQLHVAPAEARTLAEQLLDGKLICPLGGTYQLNDADRAPAWTTTALADAASARPVPPPGYQAPPINWLRGLNLRVELLSDRLSLHATVVMQMPQSGPSGSK